MNEIQEIQERIRIAKLELSRLPRDSERYERQWKKVRRLNLMLVDAVKDTVDLRV